MLRHYPGMTDGLMFPELRVPAVSRQPALITPGQAGAARRGAASDRADQ
jgi:hypothetical protein